MPNDPFEMPVVPPRKSVPVWVWPMVALSSFLLMAIYCLKNGSTDPQRHKENIVIAASFGLIVSAGLTSGLAIACWVYHGWVKRIFGTVVFGVLMMIVTAAVVFAGCECTNNIYIHIERCTT